MYNRRIIVVPGRSLSLSIEFHSWISTSSTSHALCLAKSSQAPILHNDQLLSVLQRKSATHRAWRMPGQQECPMRFMQVWGIAFDDPTSSLMKTHARDNTPATTWQCPYLWLHPLQQSQETPRALISTPPLGHYPLQVWCSSQVLHDHQWEGVGGAAGWSWLMRLPILFHLANTKPKFVPLKPLTCLVKLIISSNTFFTSSYKLFTCQIPAAISFPCSSSPPHQWAM